MCGAQKRRTLAAARERDLRLGEFQDFYEASYGRLVAVMTAILADRQEAEDVVQEAFARVLACTALGAALRRLPLPERLVVVLNYLAGLPVDAIARECGLPAGTVKTRLAAGHRHLETELARPGVAG